MYIPYFLENTPLSTIRRRFYFINSDWRQIKKEQSRFSKSGRTYIRGNTVLTLLQNNFFKWHTTLYHSSKQLNWIKTWIESKQLNQNKLKLNYCIAAPSICTNLWTYMQSVISTLRNTVLHWNTGQFYHCTYIQKMQL